MKKKLFLIDQDTKLLDALAIPDSVPVLIDFNHDKMIGMAYPKITEGKLYASFELIGDYSGLYPAIGYKILKTEGGIVKEGQLVYIGLCTQQNTDTSIPRI